MTDEKMGKYLSLQINQKENLTSECPSLETMAAFIDGMLPEQERHHVSQHVLSCDDCSELFSGILKTQQEVSQPLPQSKRKRRYYYIPYAAAAVLIFIIGVQLIMQNWSSSSSIVADLERFTFSSSPGIVTSLTDQTKAESLVHFIEVPGDGHYSFASNRSLPKVAFRTGRYLTDLQIALRGEDQEKTLELLKKLVDLLNLFPQIKNHINTLVQQVHQGTPLRQISIDDATIENMFQNEESNFFFQLGEWVEGARLAALAKDSHFFETHQMDHFIQHFPKNNVPPGVVKAFHEVKQILQQELREISYRNLEKQLNQIQSLL